MDAQAEALLAALAARGIHTAEEFERDYPEPIPVEPYRRPRRHIHRFGSDTEGEDGFCGICRDHPEWKPQAIAGR